jgi:hypothetical protein
VLNLIGYCVAKVENNGIASQKNRKMALISCASRRCCADCDSRNSFQLVRTRFKCGTCGKHIVDKKDMLAF